jgi:hypothetical protein
VTSPCGSMRLHRSITFWSGLFVLIFLGWLWRDSLRMTNSLLLPTRGQTDFIGIGGGQLYHFRIGIAPLSAPTLRWEYRPLSGGTPPPAVPSLYTRQEEGDLCTTAFALWGLMLVVAAAWLAAIYWRYRRIQKGLAAPLPPPAQPQTDLDLGT